MRLRRCLAVLVAALLTLPLAACGSEGVRIGGISEDEGTVLTVDNLKYQVQVSRQLNPHDVEDSTYLQGLPASERALRPDETWFAVFMLVQNRTSSFWPAANMFELRDTQGNRYTPIPLAPTNAFAYYGRQVPPHSQLPLPSSAPQNFPGLNGSLLLFKMRNFSYENRPLTLTVFGPALPRQQESVNLDV